MHHHLYDAFHFLINLSSHFSHPSQPFDGGYYAVLCLRPGSTGAVSKSGLEPMHYHLYSRRFPFFINPSSSTFLIQPDPLTRVIMLYYAYGLAARFCGLNLGWCRHVH
jgi:hypothetical protein